MNQTLLKNKFFHTTTKSNVFNFYHISESKAFHLSQRRCIITLYKAMIFLRPKGIKIKILSGVKIWVFPDHTHEYKCDCTPSENQGKLKKNIPCGFSKSSILSMYLETEKSKPRLKMIKYPRTNTQISSKLLKFL